MADYSYPVTKGREARVVTEPDFAPDLFAQPSGNAKPLYVQTKRIR